MNLALMYKKKLRKKLNTTAAVITLKNFLETTVTGNLKYTPAPTASKLSTKAKKPETNTNEYTYSQLS